MFGSAEVGRPAIGREDAFEGSPIASIRRIADIRRTTPLRQITSGRKRHQRARGDAHVAIFGAGVAAVHHQARSEEHTSELQSLMRISYAVFCLKKKNNTLHQYCI